MSNSHVLKRVPISTRTTEGEKTGGWRNNRPVIDQDECTMCLMCQKKCPESSDSSIYVENNVVYINLDYCKGCGICAYECPKNAIVMQQEASFK